MNFANQASGLASLGRGDDSMLVHMTPGEVESLQQLAMNNGGSLTTNPETGLPEAGFLGDILPAIAGVGLTMMGVPPIWAGLGIGALTGLVTGDLGKGVSAGLGGFGGASLGSGLKGMQSAVTPVSEVAKIGATTPSAASLYNPASLATSSAAAPGSAALYNPASLAASKAAAPSVMSQIGAGDFSRFAPNFGDGFGSSAASKLIGTGGKGAIKSGLLALTPAFLSGMQDQTGGMPAPGDADDMSKRYPYKGPYKFDEGAPSYLTDEQLRDADSSEWNYFPNIRYPQKYYAEGGQVDSSEKMYFQPSHFNAAPTAPSGNAGIARIQNAIRSPGGLMGLVDPSFNTRAQANQGRWNQVQQYLRPAGPMGWGSGEIRAAHDKLLAAEKQKAEANQKTALAAAVNPVATGFVPGKGYSDQGEQPYFAPEHFRFAEGGSTDEGRYLQGPGDGMSDDIPAVIDHGGGKEQPARLAAGEFVIPADVVSHLGNGDSESGAKRLYAMMDKVRHARTGNPKQGKQINPDKFLLA